MEIGMPNNPFNDIIKELEWIGKNNFDFVDIFLEEDRNTYAHINVQKVKEVLKKYNLKAVGHTPWYLPMGHPVKEIRDTTIREIEKYLKVFSKLEVKFVTIHTNWGFGLSEKKQVRHHIDILSIVTEIAKKYNIKIMLEPSDDKKNSLNNINEILRNVKDLYLNLDIGHANLHGKNPEDFIKKFHKKLKLVHLHDNYGEKDLHLPMGTGNINWNKLISCLKKKYNGKITLEIFSNDKNYILFSKEKLKKLWAKS